MQKRSVSKRNVCKYQPHIDTSSQINPKCKSSNFAANSDILSSKMTQRESLSGIKVQWKQWPEKIHLQLL